MCCNNKKRKQQKQAQLQRYLDSKLTGKQLQTNKTQSLLNKQQKNSKIDINVSQQIKQQQTKPLSQVLDSKLTMEKVFSKSRIKVQQSQDPKIIHLFKDCQTEVVDIKKITTQHLQFVKKYDYFQTSQQHSEQLRNIVPQQQITMANYFLSDPYYTTTPCIRSFSYNSDIIDINYEPKINEYRANYHNNNNNNNNYLPDDDSDLRRSRRSKSDMNYQYNGNRNSEIGNKGEFYGNGATIKSGYGSTNYNISPIRQYKFQNRDSFLSDKYE